MSKNWGNAIELNEIVSTKENSKNELRVDLIMEALDKGRIESYQDALDIDNDKDFNVYRNFSGEVVVELKVKSNSDDWGLAVDLDDIVTRRKPKTKEQIEQMAEDNKNKAIRKAERERKKRVQNYNVKDDAIIRVHDRNNKENKYEFIISDELQKVIDENNDFSDELDRLEKEKFNRMIKRNQY